MLSIRCLMVLALLGNAAAAADPIEPSFIDGHGRSIGRSAAPQAAAPAAAVAPRARRAVRVKDGQSCLPLRKIKAETAETESSLLFHSTDGNAYRNHLPSPCDGLLGINDLGQLGFAGSDGKLCAGDAVWLKRPGLLNGGGDDAARCKLGPFEAISEMSVTELLRR